MTALHVGAEDDPALDVAISHALLLGAARDGAESLRLWRPRRAAISVGRLDLRDPRAPEVLELTRAAGVPAVKRLAGGRAATLDGGCLCLGWAQPNPRMEDSGARYERVAEVIIEALTDLGVGASLSEAIGEWCPGAWSVQGPTGKLAGLAQRVISGGAWCEALIVIDRDPALTSLAQQVHAALDLPWSDTAQGQLAGLVPDGIDPHTALAEAVMAALGRQWDALEPAPPRAGVRALAAGLADGHRWE